jgi:hypothetical protein
MKTWLQLEELALFLFSIYLFAQLPFAWWWYPLLFFSPDLSMVFMAAGKRLGGLAYNLIHHRALALGLFVMGAWLALPALSLAGVILLGHASLDRLLGFGLMEGESFTHAHLKLTGTRASHGS